MEKKKKSQLITQRSEIEHTRQEATIVEVFMRALAAMLVFFY